MLALRVTFVAGGAAVAPVQPHQGLSPGHLWLRCDFEWVRTSDVVAG